MSIGRKELRNFSKKESPEERQELVEKMKGVRRSYAATKKRITELETRIHEQHIQVERAQKEFATAEDAVQKQKERLIEKVYAFLGKPSLDMAHLFQRKARIQERIQREVAFAEELKPLLCEAARMGDENRRALTQVKEEIKTFYEKEKTAWEKKDVHARNLGRVIQEHGVTVTHALLPHDVPDGNSLIRSGVDWRTKIRIVAGLSPTVCASTVKEGDTADRMWYPAGILLGGGSVQDAAPGDNATRAQGRKTRSGEGIKQNPTEKIRNAIEGRDVRGQAYNEITVSNPIISGLFVCTDGGQWNNRDSAISLEEMAEMGAELGLPTYEIFKGKTYKVALTPEGKAIRGEEVHPEEMITKEDPIPAEKKEKLLSEALEESPFDVQRRLRELLDASYYGKLRYIELNHAQYQGESVIWGDVSWSGFDVGLAKGDEIKIIADIPQVANAKNLRIKYFTANGKVYSLSDHISNTGKDDNGVWRRFAHLSPVSENRSSSQYVQLNTFGYGLGEVSLPITNTDSFLRGMQEEIQNYEEKRKNPLKGNGDDAYERDVLARIAIHLHGFADEAERMGDSDTAVRARSIAVSYIKKEEYDDFMKKRVGKNGDFKNVLEDIPE